MSGTKQQTEMAMPQVAEMRFLSEHTVQTLAMYQVYMRTLLYLSNIIYHCDTHVGVALSSYSSYDNGNK